MDRFDVLLEVAALAKVLAAILALEIPFSLVNGPDVVLELVRKRESHPAKLAGEPFVRIAVDALDVGAERVPRSERHLADAALVLFRVFVYHPYVVLIWGSVQ